MYHHSVYPVLILDVGNVLVSVDLDAITEATCEIGLADDMEESASIIKGIDALCNLGIVDMSHAIDLYCNHKRPILKDKYNAIKNKLIEFWCSENCVTPNTLILDACERRLKDHRPVMIASNMGADHYKYISRIHPFFKHERLENVLSFKIGAIKPQDSFFHILSTRIKRYTEAPKHQTTVYYVDDKEENLIGAQTTFGNSFHSVRPIQFNSLFDKEQKLLNIIGYEAK